MQCILAWCAGRQAGKRSSKCHHGEQHNIRQSSSIADDAMTAKSNNIKEWRRCCSLAQNQSHPAYYQKCDAITMENQTETTKSRKSSRSQAAKMRAKEHVEKIRDKALDVSNWFTQSRIFRQLVDWAYRVCDSNKKGHLSVEQLYSGLLLVHLNLAKYFGSAACMPPSRAVVQDLFEASDVDDSGGIDREEFNIIVKVSCAQIFGRVLINYATLIFVIPFLAKLIVDRYLDPENSYLETICCQFVGIFLFVVIVPFVWRVIDKGAHMEAGRQASKQKSERELQTTIPSTDHHAADHEDREASANKVPEWIQPKEPADKKVD